MVIYMTHQLCCNNDTDDDPCDDWSEHPMPKPQKEDKK